VRRDALAARNHPPPPCEDRVLDGPASGEKGSKGTPLPPKVRPPCPLSAAAPPLRAALRPLPPFPRIRQRRQPPI